MRDLTKPLLVVALALAVPIVPFLIGGKWFEAAFAGGVRDQQHPALFFGLVCSILAVDVFLPVPSSGVGTLAGAKLGTLLGTVAVWLGLTMGAIVGFGLARAWGRPIAMRLAGREELSRLEPSARRWGAWVLLGTRPLPILAEAAVLLLGATGLSWRSFWWPVAAGNLVLAVCFAALGDVAARHGWLFTAVIVALLLPLVVAWLARGRLSSHPGPPRAQNR